MSFLSKIPEPIVALVEGAIIPIAEKAWHVLFAHEPPASIKTAAKASGKELLGQLIDLGQEKLGLGDQHALEAWLVEQAGAMRARQDMLDTEVHLAKLLDDKIATIAEQRGVIEELQAKVAELEDNIAAMHAIAATTTEGTK